MSNSYLFYTNLIIGARFQTIVLADPSKDFRSYVHTFGVIFHLKGKKCVCTYIMFILSNFVFKKFMRWDSGANLNKGIDNLGTDLDSWGQ